jgi:hypothetical protein
MPTGACLRAAGSLAAASRAPFLPSRSVRVRTTRTAIPALAMRLACTFRKPARARGMCASSPTAGPVPGSRRRPPAAGGDRRA